ncbi:MULTISPECIES: PaaI family thioesterase [Actinomyces]|uniref:PaaI family thioesterase n=1 Tax=Actinomyces TaxID=1654 RepID=UPI0019160DD9|nr:MULTISPECIES: hotdog fold thioesterase [Actinomyces]
MSDMSPSALPTDRPAPSDAETAPSPISPDAAAWPAGAGASGESAESPEVTAAFPPRRTRQFPVPLPPGSAVSAASAMGTAMEDREAGTLMATLGMQIIMLGAQRTVMRMPVEGARQASGVLHGGASAALIETAASFAARRAAPEGMLPMGAELQVSHLRPVRQGWVTAVAQPVHVGRKTCVYEVVLSDDEGRTTARGTLRSMFV